MLRPLFLPDKTARAEIKCSWFNMIRGAKYFLLMMTFVGFAGRSAARSDSDSLPRRLGSFQVRTWTSADGLPQNGVSCLKHTRDGYLWIGTYFGLARLDGLGLTVFTSANTPALESNTINCLAEDEKGALWVGTSRGLLRYRNHVFEKISLPSALENVLKVLPGSSGSIWLHVDKSIVEIKGGICSRSWEQQIENATHILSIAEGINGTLNVFTHDAWVQIAADGSQRTKAVRSSSPGWLCALYDTKSDTVLLGTRKGLFLLAQGKCEPVAARDTGGKSVDRIMRDRHGNLWLDVNGTGIFFGTGDHLQMLNLGEGFDNESNLSVEQDLEDSVWLGTRNGLVQLHERLVASYGTRQGLSHNKVWSVCETQDGVICAGTEGGLSTIKGNGMVERYESPEGSSGVTVRLVWPGPDGSVYLARNKKGLFKRRENNELLIIPAAALPGPMTALYENQSGMMFVAGERGIASFEAAKSIPGKLATNLIEVPKTFAMFQAGDGTLWCGTDGFGLAHVQSGSVSWLRTGDGLLSDSIWCICPEGTNTLWLGTDKGLVRWKAGRLTAITRAQGLREEAINCLLRDNLDGLWLSGQQGIYRVSFNELNSVADGRSETLEPFALGTGDGMETPETNGGKQPAGWRARDGKLWFPTMRGVVCIDPAKVPIPETPPPVEIQQVTADDRIIYGDFGRSSTSTQAGKHELKPGHGHVVEFTYTANSFVDPKALRFKYRLTGTGNSWSAETTDRTARYINLKPGEYTFEVIGANSHNVWNRTAAAFNFYLAPHFWETWTFYFLAGCGLLGMAIGIQAYRLRWQRRLLLIKQESALAAERARIARDLHDDVGTALTGLALELDVAGRNAKEGSAVPGQLHESATTTRNLAERIRQVVWTVNPNCDNVSSLVTFLEQQVSQFLRSDQVRLRLDFPDEIPDLFLGGAASYELALVVREALTNVVRHSQATEVTLSLKIEEEPACLLEGRRANGAPALKLLVVKVKDNGRGMSPDGKQGNGFSNMKTRLAKLGGKFECVSAPGAGTAVSFIVPVPHAAKKL
jgi:signal transduction histidine kinase/ligand-binding sensor domain-containing protein